MNKFITLNSANRAQKTEYKEAIKNAFPPIIAESEIIKNYWSKLEESYAEFQFLLLSGEGDLIGIMNTIPFHFNHTLSQLPDRGWDWMLKKGITDIGNTVQPNYLGGLQVIVRTKYQNQGYSKIILNYAKDIINNSNFNNLIIPIRPTRKHEFPAMDMSEYLNLKKEDKLYDPWIRTHLNGGAQVINICEQSMIMKGNIAFWETILNQKIYKSGRYMLDGALKLIKIDVENDTGEYIEPNIWIKY